MHGARVDLHTHTLVSDGTLSPTQLVQAAAHAKLAAIAVTDHDHVGGISEARAAGARVGIEVITGIELSCEHDGRELHLLGYLVDEHDRAFLAKLETLRNRRDERNAKILQRLGALGVRVSGADIAREAKGAGSVGRPHIARAMMRAGLVASISEAFDKWLGEGKPAYVAREHLEPAEAIALVHAAGGVASVAHPGLLTKPVEAVRSLAAVGLDGVEVWHAKNPPELRDELLALAKELDLVPTGGSDFHGENKPDVHLGQEHVAYATVDALKERARSMSGPSARRRA